MEISKHEDILHGQRLEDFDPITNNPINPETK